MPSNITAIDVSGDTNMGNKALMLRVGQAPSAGPLLTPLVPNAAPGSLGPMAWDSTRTAIYSADTTNDTVTQLLLSPFTGTFLNVIDTLTLPTGAAPLDVSFQYFNTKQTQDYVVDQGSPSSAWGPCAAGEGGLSVITQATATVKTTVCLGAGSVPVAAWIFQDQSKVFVADYAKNLVYVVSASTYKVTNTIALPSGTNPFKFAQSNDGTFIYVLDQNGFISIIDGLAETVKDVPINSQPLTTAPAIDIAQTTNFGDTSANTQANHVWILHSDGTVSVWDATVPGDLSWITSISTGANPTNLVLLRDGSWAYVGLGGTNQMVAIDTTKLASQAVTQAATTNIGLDVLVGGIDHKLVTQALDDTTGAQHTVTVEATTPMVNSVGTSRQGMSITSVGASALLAKAYATTTTTTTYFCYDANVAPTPCTSADPWSHTASFLEDKNGDPVCSDLGTVPDPANPSNTLYAMTCPDLFNGTAVVAGAQQQASNGVVPTPAIPVNTQITTVPAPSRITYCDAGNPATGDYDGQKGCPAMIPVMVLGRS